MNCTVGKLACVSAACTLYACIDKRCTCGTNIGRGYIYCALWHFVRIYTHCSGALCLLLSSINQSMHGNC